MSKEDALLKSMLWLAGSADVPSCTNKIEIYNVKNCVTGLTLTSQLLLSPCSMQFLRLEILHWICATVGVQLL